MVTGIASAEACCNVWAIDKTVAMTWQYAFKGSAITCGQPSGGNDGCAACPADPSIGLACRFFPATTMAECCSAAGAFLGGALWQTTFNGQPLSCGGK
jgi:hypothetical protein